MKQPFDHADDEAAFMWKSWCPAFRLGAQECRAMLARFVEQGGDAVTAASIRANWNPPGVRTPSRVEPPITPIP